MQTTKINAATIQRKASDHPAYTMHADFVLEQFRRDYPKVLPKIDITTMRAILAGDVTFVRVRKGVLGMWFTDELHLLDAMNEAVREHNRKLAREAAARRRKEWALLSRLINNACK